MSQPDRVLDLHGMNLDSAWPAIDRALEQAIARGERVLAADHRPPSSRRAAGRARANPRGGPRLARRVAPRRTRSQRSAARTGATAAAAASTSFCSAPTDHFLTLSR